jgi:hypothetical protein
MCPSRQPGWQAIDGGLIYAIHHTADTPVKVDPVQATILMTDIL